MSKILVDSEEYFKFKNRINELLETNKKLKEKYVYLEKKFGIEEDLPALKKKIEQLNTKQNELNKKLSNIQKENDNLKDANKELTILKNDAETKNNNTQKENNKLNKMLEEFIRPRKTKTESKPIKKEFNLDEFNKEYNAFIEKLKKNKKK